jgi:hypothetical protein
LEEAGEKKIKRRREKEGSGKKGALHDGRKHHDSVNKPREEWVKK